MKTQTDAKTALLRAWPTIVRECRRVLGSEQHYQAMVYHCLRTAGRVPIKQLGMNVKIGIYSPKSPLFKKLAAKRHEDYQGHFEPIPDVVFFPSRINGDWRRRQFEETLKQMIGAIEIKASEHADGHLQPGEIVGDIQKLEALRYEKQCRHRNGFYAAVMVIETAPKTEERMTQSNIEKIVRAAKEYGVDLFYLSKTVAIPPV